MKTKNLYFIASVLFLGLFLLLITGSSTRLASYLDSSVLQVSTLFCGVIFNLMMTLVYSAFGRRVFKFSFSALWFYLQVIINFSLLTNSMPIFFILIALALVVHIRVSKLDVFQTIKHSHHFLVFSGFSTIALVLLAIFAGNVFFLNGIYTISQLQAQTAELNQFTVLLGVIILALMVGIFPFHFWVKPIFLAPTRYGLAAIIRLNIGFVFWCKFGFLMNAAFQQYPKLILLMLTSNLVYSALILFGERKLSGIAASLYQWHVPLFILNGVLVQHGAAIHSVMDFFNTSICISSLVIIIAMLRDRIGPENLDSATGLAISFPIFGLSFLFCVLSLIGFPGTLGFMSIEILLHNLSQDYWPVAGCFVLALALNGYSCFRIFGDSFYGNPLQIYNKIFQPKPREKIALLILILIVLVNGLGPDLLVRIYNYVI